SMGLRYREQFCVGNIGAPCPWSPKKGLLSGRGCRTIDLLNWLTGTTGQPAHTTAPRLTHGARARTPCRDQPLRASRRERLEPPGVVPRREQAKERVRQARGACGPNNGRASDAALAGIHR